MPDFRRPGNFSRDVYPHQAGVLIDGLRRFIGHDTLVQRTREYRSAESQRGSLRMVRLRDHQPLIEAFEAYEKATRRRQRRLRAIDDQLGDLANVAAHYGVVAPTLAGAVLNHHREKLINLNGQLKPLLLEWKTASHFAQTHVADIAWLPVDQSGPEFIARWAGLECEVECKRQSHNIVDLLGLSEADILAQRIIDHVTQANLCGDLLIQAPDDFQCSTIDDVEFWASSLAGIRDPGSVAIELPGGLRLNGELALAGASPIGVSDWHAMLEECHLDDARLYSQAKAVGRLVCDPIVLQVVGPRRTGVDLVEHLWNRKFSKAAAQCSGRRGAMLAFEWEGIADPSIFRDSDLLVSLMDRTFDEHRHVAAIAMRCDAAPARMGGLIDYATGAYLARSRVTDFPDVRDALRLDDAQ